MMTMRVLFGLLVYILSCGTLQGIQDYEITYPERLHSRRHRRDLSTAIDGGHEHSVKFAIKAFQNNWVLDANINERVTPQTVLLRQFDADDSEIITQESPDICHYQGSIRGILESVVALTTCNGLSGVIDDGVETYHIEPHTNYKDTGAHKIYPAKRRKGFGVPEEPDFDKQKIYGNDESLLTQQINRVRRNVANVEDQYKPYLTTNETRYNEVLFVVDHGIYKRFGKNIRTTVERLITLCNILDAIYQRINIRVVMSALEIWTNGPRFRRRFGDFKLFGDYLKEEVRGRVHFDNAHFLSHYSWRGANGLGWIGAMCGSGSYAINSWSHAWGSLIGPYIVVAHEMGHNFNFPHYSAKCKCLSPKGCVMQYYPKPRMLGFSDCSLNALKRINDRCLYNVPTLAINSKCGNGIREGNEECDCGTPEMCKAKDPCCMPHDCRLKPGALCSDQHHTCCNDCLFKRQGTLCRPVKTDCDVPEYCPGDSRDCPADISLQDGTPCNTANKSYCFTGKCAETRNEQCRDLWGPRSVSANQACYDKLNTEANGYGTCDATSNSPCATADVLCGQIQCSTNDKRPVVDYGKSYKQMTLNGSSAARCSAAVLKKSDMVGQGMVNDGTKCGDQKMCMNSKCKSFKKLNITKCPSVNGIECNGRGRCTSLGTCHCHSGYDPNTACEKVLLPIDGGFTTWTNWSICTKGCDTGKQSRYRFCNNPAPQHGGKDCQGEKAQEQQCNKVPCPKAHSCRHLQLQAISNNLDLPDAIYKIYPQGLSRKPILAYCDMSRDGGGWTLLVTSRTNTWNAKNIMLRNIMSPSLTQDYSILKYADDIKNNINVSGTTFEYRLEAQARGRWGGIWQADRSYTFTATTNAQTDVKLIKKFDNWDYSDNGIEKRMPWIKFAKRLHFAILTTSRDAYSKFWGTIAAPFKGFHPAPWIYGHLKESNPDVIWYWMREGPWQFPR